jgi:glutathione S-transferase
MLTLYDFGNSVCCQKVRITMRAKGLSWEPVKVDLFFAMSAIRAGPIALSQPTNMA